MASWEHTDLMIDGRLVKAQAPIIVSASRSTDIPAFYADWFFDRLEKGYSAWTNPFNGVKSYVSRLKTLCKGIKTGIADLKKSIESELVQTQSAINVNRWILIIGLIALITLHFIKL